MLTAAHIQELYPRADTAHTGAILRNGQALFDEFGIGAKPQRLHFFLAQIGHESGGLTVTEEKLGYSAERMTQVWPGRFPTVESARPFAHNPEKLANKVYSNRLGNSDEASGDGWSYRGRGYIQITGRDGYRNVGRLAGLDLEGQPGQAATADHALRVACAFWQWKSLNELCDGGDFVAVTKRINGGTIGLPDRQAWLDKVRRTLGTVPPAGEEPSVDKIIAVQRALQERGYAEVGAADGVVGRRTMAAITRFRQENGLPAGGIDRALEAALGIPA